MGQFQNCHLYMEAAFRQQTLCSSIVKSAPIILIAHTEAEKNKDKNF